MNDSELTVEVEAVFSGGNDDSASPLRELVSETETVIIGTAE